MNIRLLACAALASLALEGCGGGMGTGVPAPLPQPVPQPEPLPPLAPLPVLPADPIDAYVGTWTRCEGLATLSSRYVLKISKESGSLALVEFRTDTGSPGCNVILEIGQTTSTGRMELAGGTKAVEGRAFDKAVFTAGGNSRKELIGFRRNAELANLGVDVLLELSFLPKSDLFNGQAFGQRDAEGYPAAAGVTFQPVTPR